MKSKFNYRSYILTFISLFTFVIVFFLGGCDGSKEADLLWEKTVKTNTQSAYQTFANKYPNHSKTKEAIALAQDFRITLVEKAPARLDGYSLEGKTLTFVFVDIESQWSEATGNGKPENVSAVFKGNKISTLKAVIHWSWEGVDIDMNGRMTQMNGGSFINTEPLKEYPGHPTKFPSEEGWFIYKFEPKGTIRLGLFFEGNSDEIESLKIFGQLVTISNLEKTD